MDSTRMQTYYKIENQFAIAIQSKLRTTLPRNNIFWIFSNNTTTFWFGSEKKLHSYLFAHRAYHISRWNEFFGNWEKRRILFCQGVWEDLGRPQLYIIIIALFIIAKIRENDIENTLWNKNFE